MKHSDFQKEYHWMNGLSEYFKFNGQEERYDRVHKALYHNNWYRKRDLLTELCQSSDIETERHLKSWMNLILHEHLTDIEIKAQLVATFIRKYMREDEFVSNVCKFINYWAGAEGEGAQVPDLNDFLSRGQVKSKLWMVTELAKVVEGSLGNVAFYGGWYNFMAYFLFSQFEVDKVYSLDVDSKVIDPSKRLYPKQVEQERFLPKTVNVSKIKWNNNIATVPTNQTEGEDPGEYWELDKIDMIINTSCEHMNNEWFDNLPDGTLVVLQTNDYFDNPQHSNCCKDLEEAKNKYPMQSVMYEGELDTSLYNRFMLIGIK